jgi:hypothetical protein
MNYVEFVTGSVKNRNTIVPITDVKLNGAVDCYRSLFIFGEDLKHYVSTTGSVTGFSGVHVADYLVFDFDGELIDVKKSAIEFIQYLYTMYDVPVEYARASFSGRKGFHVSLPFVAVTSHPRASTEFYKTYRGIATDIAGDWKYLDTSIYDIRRIIRMVNTRHSGSNLFKIPLTFHELQTLNIDEIKRLAGHPRPGFEVFPVSEISEVEALSDLYEKHSKKKLDVPKKHSDFLALLKGVGQGGRNNAAIKITGHFINKGLPEDEAVELVSLWNERNKPPLTHVDGIVRSAYRRYGGTPIEGDMADYFYTPERAYTERYQEYVKNSLKGRVTTGFVKIDGFLRGLRSGEVLCIVAKAGNAKSSVVQNIGHNFAKQSGLPVLFFSLEMPLVSVVERSFQIETGLSGYDVEAETLLSLNGHPSAMQARLVFDAIPNFITIEKSGLTLEQIKQLVRFGEENIYHKKTGLILIDYLSLLDGRGKDIFEKTALLARELKTLAKELDIPVIFLSQTTKNKSATDTLELDDGRDSGAISEASDFVLGIWKTDETDCDINYTVAVLKNRRGKTGKISVSMNRRSLRFTEIE